VTQVDGQSSLRQPSQFEILAGPMLNLMELELFMAVPDAFIAFTNIAKAIETSPGAFLYFASATISCQTGQGQSCQCHRHIFRAFWKPFPQIIIRYLMSSLIYFEGTLMECQPFQWEEAMGPELCPGCFLAKSVVSFWL